MSAQLAAEQFPAEYTAYLAATDRSDAKPDTGCTTRSVAQVNKTRPVMDRELPKRS